MLKVEQVTGKRPALLQQPPFPDEFGHVIRWLAQLPCPCGWQDVQAFAAMTGRTLAGWEIDLLMRLDRVRQS